MIKLGERIKALRLQEGRTQEALANKLGVTAQAVSRWEKEVCYPDMELIPSLANCFGITIDELFGYRNDRDRKINAIIERISRYGIPSRSDDAWIDECVAILREGLIEFPGNEKLLITLADTLSEAGWRKYQEWMEYDDEGYLRHRYEIHQQNPYWKESIRICENLVASALDSAILTRAISILVLLYRNIGETEKAAACAMKMPRMRSCREALLASASDGKAYAKYAGEFLLEAARLFSEQVIGGLMANRHHYESDMPIEKINGAIALFALICDDGNLGVYHDDLIKLYLYLSRVQWERGYRDDAFASLDRALHHAKALEHVLSEPSHRFTAPLVALIETDFRERRFVNIAEQLPEDWPFWSYPECGSVKAEIRADPRWKEWVEKTKA